MKLAFMCPGQGSQFVGMGQDLAAAFPVAKEVFDTVNEALGQNLSELMWNGPETELTLTPNTQPALMAHSVAVARVLEAEFGIDMTTAAYIAGHSLGEYSALCAAGALTLEDTARLLRIRGDAMQSAVPVGEGAMAALLGASMEDADMAAGVGASVGICQIANDNATGQVVISGEKAAVEAAAEAAREMGVKKAVMLPVSAPFHCDLMQPAADRMAEALEDVEISSPVIPVVNNITARPTQDPDQIRNDLVSQVTGRVRWRESVEWMAEDGVTDFAEIGTGKTLSVMLRRIAKDASGHAVGTPEQLETFAQSLSAQDEEE